MKIRLGALILGIAFTLALAGGAGAQTSVTYYLHHYEGGAWVEYGANDPFPAGGDQAGTNLWRYTYELCNYSFTAGIRELNVFFNSDDVLCSTFSAATQPTDWVTYQVGPFAPANNWRARFRTLVTAARLYENECSDDFSVEFTWVCGHLPGSQNYDAVSTTGSHASQTIPATPSPAEATSWGKIKALY